MDFLTDPVLGTFVWGPIMGVVFQLLLTPPEPKSDNSITVNQAVTIYQTEIHHHYHGGDDRAGEAAFAISAVALLFGAWVYLNHAATVLQVMSVLASFTFGFAGAFLTRGYVLGRLRGGSWVPRLLPPVILALLRAPVLGESRRQVSAIRQNHPAPFTLGEIIGNVLHPFGSYVALQAMGVFVLGLALVTALLNAVHYVALGGVTEPSQARRFRGSVLRATERFSGWKGVVAMYLFLAAAWLLATATVYQWLRMLTSG